MELDAVEFLYRFLLHVLPSGLPRIRHYGLLANHRKNTRLPRCRQLLGQHQSQEVREQPLAALMLRLTGLDISLCPQCPQGRLGFVALLPPTAETLTPASPRAPPLPPV